MNDNFWLDYIQQGYMGGISGNSFKELKDGDEKHEVTHYLISEHELSAAHSVMNSQQTEIRQLREEIEKLKRQNQDNVNRATKKVAEFEEECQKQYQEKEAVLDAEIAHANNLNKDLIRTATERANQARNKPKKGQGYFYVGQQTVDKSLQSQYNSRKREQCRMYLTSISTPWDMGVHMDEALSQIHADIKSGKTGVLADQIKPIENLGDPTSNEFESTKIWIFDVKLRTDRNGLWEAQLLSNKPLSFDEGHRLFKGANTKPQRHTRSVSHKNTKGKSGFSAFKETVNKQREVPDENNW
jgi:cell division septum initiation protein DivIVA